MNTCTHPQLVRAGLCALVCFLTPQAWSADAKAETPAPKAQTPPAPKVLTPAPKPLDFDREKALRDAKSYAVRLTFDKEPVDQLPAGWTAAKNGDTGTIAKWKIVETKSNLGQRQKALACYESNNVNNELNLLIAENNTAEDLTLQADFLVLGGKRRIGGGLIWRVKDKDNYYLARWHKDGAFRVYIMRMGVRTKLAEVWMEVDTSLWHEIGITHQGSQIVASLDKTEFLRVENDGLTGPGKIGLWTKDDALTAFRDIRLTVAKAAPAAVAPAAPAPTTAPAAALTPVKVRFPGGRIAVTSDGNQHDPDDFGATALTIALINAAGLNSKFVHYDFANHLGNNSSTMEANMVESAVGGAERFHLNKARVFNDQSQLAEAIENFRIEGNKSTAADPLWFICAGPMETAWRCINAVDPAQRQFIHCISHSGWNDNHGDTPEMTHKWGDLGKLGATLHHIRDQNNSQNDAAVDTDFNSDNEYWYWLRLKKSNNPDWQWLYSRNVKTTYDASDTGMLFWLITGGPNGGNEQGGSAEAEYLMKNPVK